MLVSAEGISLSSWLRQGLTSSRVLLILLLSLVRPFPGLFLFQRPGSRPALMLGWHSLPLSVLPFHQTHSPQIAAFQLFLCRCSQEKTHLCLHNVALTCCSNANLRGSFLILWGRLKDSADALRWPWHSLPGSSPKPNHHGSQWMARPPP